MILLLTEEQHIEVVKRMLKVAKKHTEQDKIYHKAGFEYTSLMNCFILHIVSSAETLTFLADHLSIKWFPSTIGYIIARSMFEVDITAHFISQKPKERAERYIDYNKILRKKELEALKKHSQNESSTWKEIIKMMLKEIYCPKEQEINTEYEKIKNDFEFIDRKGKTRKFNNWSKLTLREMAEAVDHKEAYDFIYVRLSNFTHGNIDLADRFLHNNKNGPFWSVRSKSGDVGYLFRDIATILQCFLTLFGTQFQIDWDAEIKNCWNFPRTEAIEQLTRKLLNST